MTVTSPEETVPARSRSRLVVVLSALCVLLVLVCLVLALVVRAHRATRSDAATARENALAAGRQAILNLDALSATTIDKDLARVVAGATGTFKDQFVKAQGDLKSLVVAGKTESQGKILSAGVVRSDLDTATVLVAVDRLVKDTAHPDGVTAHDRWKLDLERHDGRWLVSALDAVA